MVQTIESSGASPLFPFLYLTWSDSTRGADEIRAIRDAVDRVLEETGAADRDQILSWLDPDHPPGPDDLTRLGARVRGLGSGLPRHRYDSIAELSLDLAGDAAGRWAQPAARAALDALEEAVGVVGREAARALLTTGRGPAATRRAPLFDEGELARFLARPLADLRASVLSQMADPPLRIRPRPDMEAYRRAVLEAVAFLAEQGYGRLPFPREFGGEDDPGAAIALFETLAFGDLSVMVKYGVQFGLFGGTVLQLGTRGHHERYLPDIASLDLPGCFAMTEVGHGSNVRDLRTTATYDPETDELVVNSPTPSATKDWIGNAARDGRMASVFAQLVVGGHRYGVHVVLVPIRTRKGKPAPGVTISDRGEKAGLLGVDNGRLAFDQVRVPRSHLLDRYGRITDEGRYDSPIASDGRRFFTMLGALVAGRISIAAASVSVAKTALTTAIRYSDRRVQFGPAGEAEVPILDYLLQQRALLPRLATTYGLHFAVRDLVHRYERAGEEDLREVEALAAGLKVVASDHAMGTIQAAREACGGEGYAAANRFGELREDADVFTTFEGTNPVLLQLLAKALLGQYQDEMGDLTIWDVVRHLADRGQTRVSEMNPVVVRNTEPDHLRDPKVHAAALAYREERLLGSVARRLKSRIDDGMDSFDAMNACQDHLASLALAHVDRVIQARFVDGVSRAPTPGLSEVLGNLASLYGLSRMEAHRAWYLEAGYVEAGKSRAIRAQVNTLCGEVRDVASFLVSGFGIPDDVLDTPAGARD